MKASPAMCCAASDEGEVFVLLSNFDLVFGVVWLENNFTSSNNTLPSYVWKRLFVVLDRNDI